MDLQPSYPTPMECLTGVEQSGAPVYIERATNPESCNTEPDAEPSVLTEDDAKEQFDFLASQSQIPFKNLRGCHSRAHEMCRLLSARGIIPRKVWLYANPDDFLRPTTDTVPEGFVEWAYHVAPLLITVDAKGRRVDKVIDPSLHDRPVTIEEWIQRQGSLTARAEISTSRIFLRLEGDAPLEPISAYLRFDGDYSLTTQSLAENRAALEECQTIAAE